MFFVTLSFSQLLMARFQLANESKSLITARINI